MILKAQNTESRIQIKHKAQNTKHKYRSLEFGDLGFGICLGFSVSPRSFDGATRRMTGSDLEFKDLISVMTILIIQQFNNTSI